MKKTVLIMTMSSMILMTLCLVGCKNSRKVEPATPDTMLVEENEQATPVALWQTTIDEYLTDVIGKRTHLDNVLIVPNYTVLAVDSSDNNDYRVWGDWQVFAYDTDGETLITSMAVWAPGLFHLKKTTDGFEVKQLEEVEEGRAIEENAQRIFGKYCDAFWEANRNQEYNDSLRRAMMSEYVRKNNLPYTRLELDSSQPPVNL